MAYPSHTSPTPLEQKGSQQKLHQKKANFIITPNSKLKMFRKPLPDVCLIWFIDNLKYQIALLQFEIFFDKR